MLFNRNKQQTPTNTGSSVGNTGAGGKERNLHLENNPPVSEHLEVSDPAEEAQVDKDCPPVAVNEPMLKWQERGFKYDRWEDKHILKPVRDLELENVESRFPEDGSSGVPPPSATYRHDRPHISDMVVEKSVQASLTPPPEENSPRNGSGEKVPLMPERRWKCLGIDEKFCEYIADPIMNI